MRADARGGGLPRAIPSAGGPAATMRARTLLALALLAGAVVLAPAPRAEDAPPMYAFINGRWFDGRTFVDRIFFTSYGELDAHSPGRVDSTVDLQGAYVIPPFGEAHNHNAGMTGPDAAAITARYLREGIYYVKNPGNLPTGRAARSAVNVAGSIDVVYANGVLTAPGGHPLGLVRRNIARGLMTQADGEGAFYFTVETRADVDRKWPAILAGRPDFIKTLLLFSEEYERRRADSTAFAWKGLDPKLLPYIVSKAHAEGLRVSTHVETAADFRAAVAAGVDEINHLPGFRPERDALAGYDRLARYVLTDADARQAAAHQVVVVTTVSGVLEILAADTSAADRARVRAVRTMIVGNLRTLHRRGVPIALGSDRFRSTSSAEAFALHRLGVFDDLTLLKMWCETTAATIIPWRKLGKLADGYEASFLVLDGDPLADFEHVRGITLRVKQGRILPEP